MKINYLKKVEGISISKVSVGDTFIAKRKSTNKDGLYMKVDECSGLATIDCNSCLAVNLESGQLRKFASVMAVRPVNTEVNFIKGS